MSTKKWFWKENFLRKNCCRPPCEVVSWNKISDALIPAIAVDLLARSWVEITQGQRLRQCYQSTSLRGRELKYLWVYRTLLSWGRPPCEVVSWNILLACLDLIVHSSTSLRGRELKWIQRDRLFEAVSRPPCEVVSWNGMEASQASYMAVDLLARSWVEIPL